MHDRNREHQAWRVGARWDHPGRAGRGPFGRPPSFGGFGPPPGPGGPGRRGRRNRGDVRAAVLRLLVEEPMHGYQIIQELTARSGGVWRPSPGAVYPTLQQLEDEGLVRTEERDGRNVVELTDAGRAEAERLSQEAAAPWESDKELVELRQQFDQLAGAIGQVAQAGTSAQRNEAARLLAEARRAVYRVLADDEPPPAT